MSELIKKLERISREGTQPLGFGGIARSRNVGMMLIAQLSPGEAGTGDSIPEAVDALLFDVKDLSSRAQLLSQVVPSIGPVPWGIRLGAAHAKGLSELVEAGCDYLIFKSDVPARITVEERLGKVMEVNNSLDDSSARAIGQIAIEAILLGNNDESPLSVHRLLDYQRLIAYAGTPAIAMLPPDITDLEALWGVGVRGVVVDVRGEDRNEKLSMVKEAIQRLPASRRKPRERIIPVLPSPAAFAEELEEDI